MKTMSISLREDLHERLKYSIPSNKLSEFVRGAIARELETREKELMLAYEQTEDDQDRQKLLKEWGG